MSLLSQLRDYRRTDAVADLIAGVLTAAVLMPQALAFAALAGLPPQVGLYASVLPPLVYALIGASRVLAVGPVSVAALMVASALASIDGEGARIDAAATLALLVAALFFAAGLLRAGALINFISSPVLHGFTSGAALLIIFSQLPSLLGVPKGGFSITPLIAAIGIGSLALLFGMQWLSARFTTMKLLGRAAPLVAVVIATLVVAIGHLDIDAGVPVTGRIASAWPGSAGWRLDVSWGLARDLAPAAALIGLIAYVESAAIAKVFAARVGEKIDANRELIALGGANLAAAFSGTMPVAGGFSRTAVNADAGARSQMATIVTVLLLVVATTLFATQIARMPRAALAAVIIAGVVKLIDWREPHRLWQFDRAEAFVFGLTAVTTAFVDIEVGLLSGLALSLLWPIWKARAPHIATLGRIPGTDHFRNIERHATETWPQLLLVRIDGAWSSANASFISQWLASAIVERPATEHVVIDAGGIHSVDATALEAIEVLALELSRKSIGLHWAELRGPVTDRLVRAEQLPRLGAGGRFLNINAAVTQLARTAPVASIPMTLDPSKETT